MRLLKIFMMFVLVLSFFTLNSTSTGAAQTKMAHVNIKSGTLNVRSGAGIKYKTIGSLKKDAGVYVYSKTKSGWSEIRYKKKKAYVQTKYLKFAASYLKDKTKVYTYMSDGKKHKEEYDGDYNGWDIWKVDGNDKNRYIVDEDKNGLYAGWMESEYYVNIKYPVKVGQKWDDGYEGDSYISRITSVSKTIKTSAGTFKNCIEVKDNDGFTVYYAKNIGPVKSVYKGKTISQLIKIEDN